MIKLSAFADEVSLDFVNQLEFLSSENIKYIELRIANGKNVMELAKSELNELRTQLHDYGIGVSALASPIGKVSLDLPFEAHLDKFKYAAELASFFNTKQIRVFSYYPPMGEIIENYRAVVLGRMARKADVLLHSDIIMVHENEADIYGHTADNCLDIVQTINSPNLQLVYDPANFVWGEQIIDPMDKCWPVMAPYVHHVHIKDWKIGVQDVGCLPGEGNGQIKELLLQLHTGEYEGFVTLEPHLAHGGQFGGETTPRQFSNAIMKVRSMLNELDNG